MWKIELCLEDICLLMTELEYAKENARKNADAYAKADMVTACEYNHEKANRIEYIQSMLYAAEMVV